MGSGDGRGPYRWAAREPSRLFIATDANPDALLETAWKAGRKAARGGRPNLICIAEPLDVLAVELGAIADKVSVILPWAALLKAVATPEVESLRRIVGLCLPGADIEIVFSYDQKHPAPERHLYEQAGLEVLSAEAIAQRDLIQYDTTWAKQLAFGRLREVWRIRARNTDKTENGEIYVPERT